MKKDTKHRSRTSTQQGETQHAAPRMPHERDESADSQARAEPSAERIGPVAHDDVVRGVTDTSRSVETDATYHRLREETPSPASVKKDAPR